MKLVISLCAFMLCIQSSWAVTALTGTGAGSCRSCIDGGKYACAEKAEDTLMGFKVDAKQCCSSSEKGSNDLCKGTCSGSDKINKYVVCNADSACGTESYSIDMDEEIKVTATPAVTDACAYEIRPTSSDARKVKYTLEGLGGSSTNFLMEVVVKEGILMTYKNEGSLLKDESVTIVVDHAVKEVLTIVVKPIAGAQPFEFSVKGKEVFYLKWWMTALAIIFVALFLVGFVVIFSTVTYFKNNKER